MLRRPRRRSRLTSLLPGVAASGPRAGNALVAMAFGLAARAALAEQPLSPAAREAQQRVVLAVGAVLLAVLVVLALVTALLLRRVLRPRLPFAALSVIAFIVWAALGWATGVIPAALVFSALIGAGRTM